MSARTGTLPPEGVRKMFDRIAPVYDAMNRLMTAGLDRRWRRETANAFPSHVDAGSAVRTADSRGIVILWVPQTSPPSSAADIPARRSPRWSSTVGSGWCRPGVTAAVIYLTGGGPAWPRATPTRILAGMGVARRTHPPLLCLARIKQRRPTRANAT